jgi:predicted DsbA family dithiol-disulfide isomerase
MSQPIHIAMYADLSCPFAYLVHHRWRRLRETYRDRVVIVHKSLALEYVNNEPTPKPALDIEEPLLFGPDRDVPYQPWHALGSEWPVTIWPAFEAVKCAERQGLTAADDLAWAIRTAFFVDSRCISMRHVLIDLAQAAGLDQERFTADFDSGQTKPLVIEEARNGWEKLKVPGSPTFVLPSGEQISDFALPDLDLDEARHLKPTRYTPAPCMGDACFDHLRGILDRALENQT